MFPEELRYTKEHEWIRADGGVWTVGITDHAAELLGDVTYVEPAEAGQKVKKGQSVSAVESVKAASDVYAPCGGTVSEANSRLESEPDLVNQDPYGEGWFFKLEDVSDAEFNALMDATAYAAHVKEQED
jgi:glycine cleavage system H protein